MSLPSVPGTFHWTHEPWGAGLRCRPLEQIAPHVFTTRQLELTASGYEQLAQAIGAGTAITVAQVHGADVAVVRRGTARSGGRAQADVLVSDDPSAAIAVRAAD